MLIKEVVREFEGQVEYRDDNFGASEKAEEFGVRRYPAVFIDEILVARPQDFYSWGGDEKGRYTPWRNAESHQRFKDDLRRMIRLRLAGAQVEAASADDVASAGFPIESLPKLDLTDIDGRAVDSSGLAGKVILVEFWADWCPPCIRTLRWMSEAAPEWGDEVAVITIAIASQEERVRKLVPDGIRTVMGSDELVARFGDIPAAPTLFVFDERGRTAGVFYGAPDDLHDRVSALLERLRK